MTVGVMVAHPDDETLWAGGTLLQHPDWRLHIWTLCRAGDGDRAPKFRRVLARYGAEGGMADLDDGPEQAPLPEGLVRDTVARLTGDTAYDLFFTHALRGEYTRHRRHEEVAAAVVSLWSIGRLQARELRLFAYEDGARAYLPRAQAQAHACAPLPDEVWAEKYRIIHELYGFAADSWEAQATPRTEAFWCYPQPHSAVRSARAASY